MQVELKGSKIDTSSDKSQMESEEMVSVVLVMIPADSKEKCEEINIRIKKKVF